METISSANADQSPSPSTSRPKPRSGSSPRKSNKKKNQYSFTADSPYFTSYVDKEMKNLNVLTETLRDISAKAKTFGKCGVLMSEATRRLSQSCRLQSAKVINVDGIPNDANNANLSEKERQAVLEREKSVGEDMAGVLRVLGKVLDEVADAQMLMCESLEASLSLSLETFIGTELLQAAKLKTEAEEMTEDGEAAFAKYLHGKNAQGGSANGESEQPVSSWNKISEGVGNQLGRIGLTTAASNEISPTRRKGKDNGKEKAKGEPVDKALYAANLKLNLEDIRLSQANAELKRFQLLKHLDALKVSHWFVLMLQVSRQGYIAYRP